MRKYNEPDLESAEIVVLEVVLSPRSQLVGQTLKRETHFREKVRHDSPGSLEWRAGFSHRPARSETRLWGYSSSFKVPEASCPCCAWIET